MFFKINLYWVLALFSFSLAIFISNLLSGLIISHSIFVSSPILNCFVAVSEDNLLYEFPVA